jgi:hypothetical protein
MRTYIKATAAVPLRSSVPNAGSRSSNIVLISPAAAAIPQRSCDLPMLRRAHHDCSKQPPTRLLRAGMVHILNEQL